MALLRQFIAFGTDNGLQTNADACQAGIERSLRFVQALASLFATYRFSAAAALLPLTSTKFPPSTSFLKLRAKINVTRRLLRLFRFLEQFQLGWDLYSSRVLDFDTLLDVLGKTCLGLYGMLESVTLLDLLEVDHLEIFGAEQTNNLNYQAQVFWLIALCISLFRSSIALLRCLGKQPTPHASSNHSSKENISSEKSERQKGDGSLSENGDGSGNQMAAQSGAAESKETVTSLILKLVATTMDILLPATAVGLIETHPAVIPLAMIISTAITANDVWVRCGKEMQSR
ncbi:AoPex11B [Trichoderma gamsii]|uniref:AoPex11B n=1 Tax=Trichoderma gamsii TaxID=398673 RepID=A0A2P4Z7Z2_9HYPO|nr:AoPex11B [Trichoderma gamsii]PON20417.1 AoPex11B [Trichoderma gamsii]